MPPDANTLIKKYCEKPGLWGPPPGENAPLQDTPAKMQNHRTETFIDGVAYFSTIREEINALLGSNDAHRFFYMTAWWLGLTDFDGPLRVADSWDYVNYRDPTTRALRARFSRFVMPVGAGSFSLASTQTLEQLLKRMVEKGVDVRVLPWILPLIADKLVADKTGIGGVNFPSLISAASLRRQIGDERVLLNMLGHTWGAAHCKMVICGDSNRMRAYTSGLDPVDNRLLAPGLTPAEVANNRYGTYVAADKQEMEKVCRALANGILMKPLFDVIRVISNLPDYVKFLQAQQSGDFEFRIDVRWEDREWKLTLYDEPNDRLDISYLKRDGLKNEIDVFDWPAGGWHDLGVRVEGPAAGAIHDFFRDMWNEQLSRSVETFKLNNDRIVSHDTRWQPLPARQPINLPANTGPQYVQVLRTVPLMDFSLNPKARGNFLVPDDFNVKLGLKGHRLKIGPTALAIPVGVIAAITTGYARQRLSFAPAGCFEFKVALKKAISEATDYIFIADQGLYGLEIMDWINLRMQQVPKLKVVLLFGADPADPPNSFLAEAMNNHLLPNAFYNAMEGTQPANIVFYEWTGNAVHCKVTIIDDTWCAIGSANCMRRSLYTDIELSIAILEPPTPDNELPSTPAEEAAPPLGKKAPSFVQRLRRDLWGHYCGIPLDPAQRSDPQKKQYTKLLRQPAALAVWNPKWAFWRVPGLTLRPEISRQNLRPFPVGAPFDQKRYDREDVDSRHAF
jgi:hypothetical protein